ncbi:fibroblast growth factor 7 [Pelomyxa schiedti]|nr:fibroblast growth factor 7 [Pelomyxa schiedti]
MKIATHDELQTMSRAKCPKCGHMRKLPVDVDIIHYPTELLTKSTAVHAKLLAPTQVSIIDYPNVPDYSLSDHLLLYPSKTSVSLNELSLEDLRQVRKLVVIDSQWHKANAVLRHPNLQKLRCVKIVTSKTLFWRYQQHGDEFLATIEAIYQFMREHFEASQSSPYAGAYDNLLFYYSFFYNLIQTAYKSNPASKFTRKQNYIKY